MFNVLLILFLSAILILSFSIAGMAQGDINKDNFKKPDTLAEAEKMIDKLLDFALKYRDMVYKYKGLYEEENKDKKEYRQLYKEGRKANKQLQTIIDNQDKLNDKLQEIIERLLNKSNGIGVYGGFNYVPLNPVNSGVQGEITIDF